MSNFYLRYTNDNWATNTKLTITDYIRNVSEPYTERATGTNLNGTGYSHRLYQKNERLISISADFLADSSKYDFFKDFYKAGAWQYSDDDSTYTDVILQESGKIPVEYIEGHLGLPELTFTLIDKEAS